MEEFELQLEQMMPEEIDDFIRNTEKNLLSDHGNNWSKEEVDLLFNYQKALTFSGNHEKAGGFFSRLRDIIDAYIQGGGEAEAGLNFLADWCMMALSLIPEERDEFNCFGIYADLFEAMQAAPDKLKYRGAAAKLQLRIHWDYWLGKGGDPERLEPEILQQLKKWMGEYENEAKQLLELYQNNGDKNSLVKLYRNLARFYLTEGRAEETIEALNNAIKFIPETENYHEADKADLLIQTGQIYLHHNEPANALKLFKEAYTIYENGGEDLEMFMYQAEGWIEEAENRL